MFYPFWGFLKVPEGSWKFLEVPEGYRRFLEVIEGSWMFLDFHGGFWMFLEPRSFLVLVVLGCSWKFLEGPGGSWKFWKSLEVRGGFWRFQEVLGGSCMISDNVFRCHGPLLKKRHQSTYRVSNNCDKCTKPTKTRKLQIVMVWIWHRLFLCKFKILALNLHLIFNIETAILEE